MNTQTDKIKDAAQAVIDRWDSPSWEWGKQGSTANLIADLRNAIAEAQPSQAEDLEAQAIGEQTPVAWMSTGRTGGFMLPQDLEWWKKEDPALARLYTIPLYRSPISTEARDRAIKESVRRAVYEWMATQMDEGDTADTLLAEIGVNADAAEVDADLCKRLDQALSALRGS